MNTYFTEAEELTRQYRVAQGTRHTAPRPRSHARTRVARTLRRAADRLDG